MRAWRLAGGAQMLLPVGNRRLGTGVAAAVLVLALVGSSSAHSGKFARLVPLNPCTACGTLSARNPRTAHLHGGPNEAMRRGAWRGHFQSEHGSVLRGYSTEAAGRHVPYVLNLNLSTWGLRLCLWSVYTAGFRGVIAVHARTPTKVGPKP